MATKIEIEQIRGLAGCPQWMRDTVKSLGLRKIRHRRTLPDSAAIRGMVKRVAHLVVLREV